MIIKFPEVLQDWAGLPLELHNSPGIVPPAGQGGQDSSEKPEGQKHGPRTSKNVLTDEEKGQVGMGLQKGGKERRAQ